MPRIPLHLASGTGVIIKSRTKSIRFVRYGCSNRPFYHIIVIDDKCAKKQPPIEQLGSYDPSPNFLNEKLVALNFERVQHWIGQGAKVSRPLLEILGLAGILPIHPRTYMRAWRNRPV
ncbi:probable 28S ribosomal protein S16, mitochondrial [Copidosoma floridanum]|uniref:probable 28S ribosomal protein S16, mitochondrial n=1 Tax=Copidosoma floridanum TaxID=29053 RepID=UPI0006C9CFE5|nr:probable 28S ribosomal protein S16, mitochondrial [Copidosoma floridanum]